MDITIKPTLLRLHREACAELLTFVSSLSEAERQTVGTPERWSTKDLLGHIASWWRTQGQRFAGIARGTYPDNFDWSDELNATIFAANANRPWDAVTQELNASSTAWQAAVENLSLEDLTLPERVAAMQGSLLWYLVLGNGYLHPLMHLVEHHLERAAPAEAIRTQEDMTEKLIASTLPDTEGRAYYNLACIYAMTGRENEAIATLTKALAADPELSSYARQDQDLAAIRSLPVFQSLADKK